MARQTQRKIQASPNMVHAEVLRTQTGSATMTAVTSGSTTQTTDTTETIDDRASGNDFLAYTTATFSLTTTLSAAQTTATFIVRRAGTTVTQTTGVTNTTNTNVTLTTSNTLTTVDSPPTWEFDLQFQNAGTLSYSRTVSRAQRIP